ncbi:MAG TPA: hypothetical protein VHL81_03580 [Gemmatimonadales bacterium]|nr:hypothetical protein [Gemmatimonadales bacterium]
MIVHRILYMCALGLGVAGIAFRTQPPQLPDALPALPLVSRPRPRATPASESVTVYASIAATNAFSPSRTPPAKRFSPDDRPEARAPAPRRAPPKVVRPAARLYGITRSSNGVVALIEADPKIPGAEFYRLGDRVGGDRLAAITDSTVVLQGSGGRVVLRLPEAPRP